MRVTRRTRFNQACGRACSRQMDLWMEVLLQGLPAGVVLVLAGGCVHRELCGPADEAGFEHEGESAFEFDGLQVGGAGAGEGFGIRAVAAHAVVQAGTAWDEAFGLGVVFASDEAHELVHEVAVEPGWAEGVLGDDPARGEDGEVYIGCAGDLAGRGEDGVDGWVGVVEADRVDAVEAGEVVLAGRVVAVPGDDVEWGVVEVCSPEVALKFGDDLKGGVVAVVVGGVWGEKVASVGKAVGADCTELRQSEAGAVVFEEVAASLGGKQLDAELDAARNDGNFAGCEIDDAEFGVEHEATELGHEEKLAVGGVEEAVAHAFGSGVDVDGDAGVHGEVAVASKGCEAVDKIEWC